MQNPNIHPSSPAEYTNSDVEGGYRRELGAAALTQLRDYIRLQGPRKKDGMIAQASDMLPYVSDLTKEKAGSLQEILDGVMADVSRTAIKAGVDFDQVDKDDVLKTYGRRVDVALQEMGYSNTHRASLAARKLAINNNEQYIRQYFSDESMDELQKIAQSQPQLVGAIPSHFSTGERIRRAYISRKPLEDTRLSVQNAVDVLEHPGECGLDDTTQDLLKTSTLLTLTTRYPDSYKKILAHATDIFESLASEFPLISEHEPAALIDFTVKYGGASLDSQKVRDKIREYQSAIDLLIRDGMSPDKAVFQGLHRVYGRSAAAANLVVSRQKAEFLREQGEGSGKVQRRSQKALKAGRLTKEDSAFAGSAHDRDAIYDVDESSMLSAEQKVRIYEQIRATRRKFEAFSLDAEHVLGQKVTDAIRVQANETLTKVIYAFKYCIDHTGEVATVPMGSRDVPITGDHHEMLRALSILASRTQGLWDVGRALDKSHAQPAELDGDNVELGYVSDRVLVLTKAQRAKDALTVEHGSSARINMALGTDEIVPSAVASEREQTALSVRLDYDKDGVLRFDIGGKTDNPYTPDFMVAKLLSLGAWYKSQLHGTEAADYHLTVANDISEDEFTQSVARFRSALTYADRQLNVPPAQPGAAAQAQGAPETRPQLHAVPAQKPAA